jgi:hypothetical protein
LSSKYLELGDPSIKGITLSIKLKNCLLVLFNSGFCCDSKILLKKLSSFKLTEPSPILSVILFESFSPANLNF